MEQSKLVLVQSALHYFQEQFGPGPMQVWRSPARINILGEHVDYVSYLPTASLAFGSHEHEMVMVMRPNNQGLIRGESLDPRFHPFELALPEVSEFKTQNWQKYLYAQSPPQPDWSNYVKGAVLYAVLKYGANTGFDFVVASSIPPQGGSSSSSALVVLTGAVIRSVNNLAFAFQDLAQDSSQAEWFIGTRGGSLDHTTICLAKRHHALHLSYRKNQITQIPLPSEGVRWVTFYTQAADKGREIMLEYNERAAVARLLIPALIEAQKTLHPDWYAEWQNFQEKGVADTCSLAQVRKAIQALIPETLSLAEIHDRAPEVFQECAQAFPALVQERLEKPIKLRDRAFHHLGEIARVENAVQILQGQTLPLEKIYKLGQLITDTHSSLKELYEVSTSDIDQLHAIALSDSRVFGARLIGGGFGGNVLALTTSENTQKLIERIQNEYYSPRQRHGMSEGAVMVSTPGEKIGRTSIT